MPEKTPTQPATSTPEAGAAATVLTDPKTTAAPETKPPETKEPGKTETPPPATTETKPPEKPVVPDKYDLKLPEGSHLTAEDVQKVALFAKEKGLTQEQAQTVLERESGAVSSYATEQMESLKAKSIEWVASVKADKEIGGEGYKQNVELASRVINRFGTDSFKKALNDTHLGNHPEMVRIFARIGKMFSDDQLVLPGAPGGSPNKKSAAQLLFPTMSEEKA